MEGGNTNEYANLVLQTDEYGNPLHTTLNNARQGLSTNVGLATGGVGSYYDFGDTTGAGFGAVGSTYLNQQHQDQRGAIVPGGSDIVKETRATQGDQQIGKLSDGHGEKGDNKEATEKIKS